MVQSDSQTLVAVALLLLFVFAAQLVAPHSLFAQVMPDSGITIEEQKPQTRDPAYRPPALPEHQRRAQGGLGGLGAGAMLGGDGDVLEQLLEQQDEEERRRQSRADELRERELERLIEAGREREILERSIQRQFGVVELPYATRQRRDRLPESASRRFQIVYFLSLPFTMGLSYGLIRLGKEARGDRSLAFTGPQTAAMISGGLLLAGAVGWYDYRRWQAYGAPGRELPHREQDRSLPDQQSLYPSLFEPLPAGRRAGATSSSRAEPLHFGWSFRF